MGVNVDLPGVGVVVGGDAAAVAAVTAVDTEVVASLVERIEDVGLSVAPGEGWVSGGVSGNVVAVVGCGVVVFDISVTG